MFIGHFALGLAAKRAAPRVPLVLLFIAAQLADLLWPIFLLAGIEQVRIDPGNTAFTPLDFVSYPYSHSLLLLVLWGLALAAVYQLLAGLRGEFLIVAALVVSHWVLDYVTHRPDMPLYPSGPKLGLGLWNSIPLTIAIEAAMYAAGVWIYVHATEARDGAGKRGFGALAIFLPVAYVANLVSPPPPSVTALAAGALAGSVILLLWSWWADRHRSARDMLRRPFRG